jgi:Na+-translocating ferredoxin:NAD+ oxidoreductase RnfA subunit
MLRLKKYLIYTHRSLGVVFCVIFAPCFVSGVVMMYKRMPRVPAEERLAGLPALDFSCAALTPEQVRERAGFGEAPEKVR